MEQSGQLEARSLYFPEPITMRREKYTALAGNQTSAIQPLYRLVKPQTLERDRLEG
jgi:hypothetical protein